MIDTAKETMVDANSNSVLDSSSHTRSISLNKGAQATDDIDSKNQGAVPSDKLNDDAPAKSPRMSTALPGH